MDDRSKFEYINEVYKMLDPALVGSVVTGVLGLVAQAISKCKCRIAYKTNEDPQCICGFLDTALMDVEIEKIPLEQK